MMKKIYYKPELTVYDVISKDIIATSYENAPGEGGEGTPGAIVY